MADTTQNDASSSNAASTSLPSFNVELKKTKVIWAQPALAAPLTWTETMMDLVAFRTMLEGRSAEEGPLAVIPDEHLPLIGKLVQESEKDQKALASDIHATLSPDGALQANAVTAAVPKVAKRVNYGIDGGLKDFCVWRWEIENLDYLPVRLRTTVLQRRQDREKGQAVLLNLYEGLSTTEKTAILTKLKQRKLEAGSGGKENISDPAPATVTQPITIDLTSPEQPSVAPVASVLDVKPLVPLEVKPVEKEVKSKEKEPKNKKSTATAKAAKDAAPAPAKSNLLGYFNAKSKPTVASSSKPDVVMDDAKPEPAAPKFDQIFLPFRVKKGTTLAPINYFDQDVVVLDSVGLEDLGKRGKTSAKDTINPLESLKSSLPSSSRPRRTNYTRLHASAPPLKTTSVFSVQDLMEQLEDATNAGDVNGAKALISALSDRKKLPLRWLHFWDNTRPMWVGTWTKTARNVGPRTPFGKEDGVDYDYDSGEDWQEEEEEEGEEMEDTATVDGEDEEEDEEENPDWIVYDEDEEIEQEDDGLVLSLDEIGSGVIALPSAKGKRKADTFHGGWGAKDGTKRRKVTQLKPDCKGPLWESRIGHSQITSWSRYSIRVINDTPLHIDPLVSYNDPPTNEKPKAADGFAVPALPDRLLSSSKPTSSNNAGSPLQTSGKKGGGSSGAKAAALLADELMQKMARLVLDAPSGLTQPLMVDRVYQDLKGEGATKKAIETTLKKAFEKNKGEKKWVVREEYKTALGGAGPSTNS